jgi:hypothetical protein
MESSAYLPPLYPRCSDKSRSSKAERPSVAWTGARERRRAEGRFADGRFAADRLDVGRFAARRFAAGRLADKARFALERFADDRFDDRLRDDFDCFFAIRPPMEALIIVLFVSCRGKKETPV